MRTVSIGDQIKFVDCNCRTALFTGSDSSGNKVLISGIRYYCLVTFYYCLNAINLALNL